MVREGPDLEARVQRFRPGPAPDDLPGRRKQMYRRLAFAIGVALWMLVLTPISKVFGGTLSPDGVAVIILISTACVFLWMERHKHAKCPICFKGTLRPVDIGRTQHKLGIVDHPMFRKGCWTQWYECRFCGHREWDEEENAE